MQQSRRSRRAVGRRPGDGDGVGVGRDAGVAVSVGRLKLEFVEFVASIADGRRKAASPTV